MITSHRAWGNLTYAFEAAQGWMSLVNCEISSGGGSTIRIDDLALGVTLIGGDKSSAAFSYQSAASIRPTLLGMRGGNSMLNVVVNNTVGAGVARFESHNATPANNDSVFKSYVLTDSAGTAVEAVRETYRIGNVTPGAYTGQIMYALQNAGTLQNLISFTNGFFSPLIDNLLALGTGTTTWRGIYLGNAQSINFNNNQYAIVHAATNLVFSGTIKLATLTVATLAAPATVGTGGRSTVSDATVVAAGNFGNVVVGGGANIVPAL